MNKCRGRIVQGDYIMRNIFHKEGDWNRERFLGIIGEGLVN